MSEQDFGEFTVVVTTKPVGGITEGQIPPALAKYLEELVPQVMKDVDHELTLTAADEGKAKKLAAYARAWGARQVPKLYIKKLPNRRDMPNNIARLSVELDEEVKPENRPGRKSDADKAETPKK